MNHATAVFLGSFQCLPARSLRFFYLGVAILAAAFPSVLCAQQEGGPLVMGFEEGRDGCGGKFSLDPTRGRTGKTAAKLDIFDKAGGNVEVSRPLPFPYALRELRFWAMTREANRLTVRVVDKSGQVLQQRPVLNPNGEWQEIVITDFEKGPGHQTWGGANDKKIHWPVTSMAISLEPGYLGANPGGIVWIDDIKISFDNSERIVGNLDIEMEQFGHIFTTEEPLKIVVGSNGDAVEWVVKDYWGVQVAQGSQPVVKKRAVILPGIKRRGYFEMELKALKAGAGLATGTTSFAVIAPADVRKMPDSPFGVVTHFAHMWDDDIMPLIAKAGIGLIRDDLYWRQVEQVKGQYDFGRFDPYMQKAQKTGLQPITAVVFENPLYDKGLTPHTEEGYMGYANFNKAILAHYGKQIRFLEIWNEYNGTWCSGPAKEDRPKYYTEMLKAAYTAIKSERPDVLVLGGAPVTIPIPYFEGIFKNGGLDYADAWVIHPYRPSPEGVDAEIQDLRDAAGRFGKKDIAVYTTETGEGDKRSEGRAFVTRYLVKMYTLLLKEKSGAVCWYLMRDYNEFTTMGLLRDWNSPYGRYAPAPQYAAYANLIQMLYGTEPRGKIAMPDPLRVYRFDRKDGPVCVAWSPIAANLELEVKGKIQVVDIMGNAQTLEPVAGRVNVTLDEEPVYIVGEVASMKSKVVNFAPSQTVDRNGAFDFSYSLDLPAGAGAPALILPGIKGPLALQPGSGRTVTLPGFSTAELRGFRTRYTMTLDGKPFSSGVLNFRVEEPLQTGVPYCVGSDLARMTVKNTGVAELKFRGFSFKGKSDWKLPLDFSLPTKTSTILQFPVQGIAAYQDMLLKISAELAGRPAVESSLDLSNNPITKKTLGNASLEAWKGLPALPMRMVGDKPSWTLQWAKLAWDDSTLYVGVSGNPAIIQVEIADGEGSLASWREVSTEFDANGQGNMTMVAGAGVPKASSGKVLRIPDSQGFLSQLAIPWKDLTAGSPYGTLRLRLKCGSNADLSGPASYSGMNRPMLTPSSPGNLPIFYTSGGAPQEIVKAGEATVVRGPEKFAMKDIPVVGGRLLADQDRDYAADQGRNGWSYGYYDGQGGGKGNGLWPSGAYTDDDFKLMKFVQTVWGHEWIADPAVQHMKLTKIGAHPGSKDGKPVWAVRRWKSDSEGPALIRATCFSWNGKGDGLEFIILVDGVEAARRHVPQRSEAVLQVPVRLKKGALVDFAVNSGPQGDQSFDSCNFIATIQSVE